MRKLGFWVYSAPAYTAFTIIIPFATRAMFYSYLGGILFFVSLFAEFCIALALTSFVLKRIVEFKARAIILATAVVGWLPASLLSAWIMGLAYPRGYYPSYDFASLFIIAAVYTVFHSMAFASGALIGTAVRVSYAERLKREILFTASRSEGAVDLLKLTASLKDDLFNVTDGVLHLIKEGHIVGYLDNTTNQLHINPPNLSTATPMFPATQQTQGLAREYNTFKSLLIDLEELQKQGRISPASYDALRQEYERRLKLLESTMGVSQV